MIEPGNPMKMKVSKLDPVKLLRVEKPEEKDAPVLPGVRAMGTNGYEPIEHSVEDAVPLLAHVEAPQSPPETPPAADHIAIVGRFKPWPWGRPTEEAYLADALERSGARVWRVDQNSPAWPVAEAKWALFTGHAASFMHLDRWRDSHKTAVWSLDWLPGRPERVNAVEAARRSNLLLTADMSDWGSFGMSNRYLPGACETIAVELRAAPEIPCAFIGSVYNERRRAIADMVLRRGGVVLDRPSSWLYGERLSAFVQTVKVVVGDNFRNDVPGFWSARNYIVPGAGGFLLTPEVPLLSDHLTPGVDVAVYGSLDGLEAELDRWLSEEAPREAIRAAGFERVRRDHTWDARAKALLADVAEDAAAVP